MAARRTSLLWPTVAMLCGVALLIGLGTWQLQRKTWKEGLLAQISARVNAPPIPLGEALSRAATGEDLEYLRVRARGHLLADRERFVWAPSSSGSGWHVYVPLVLKDGRVVIVNRGFVADADRDPARRPELARFETEIVGLLRKPGLKGLFTPDNDLAKNVWYWRDLDGMASSMLNVPADPGKRVVRYFIDAEKTPGAVPAPHAPVGGTTLIELPNNHMQYVLTWYGLAVTLIAVYAAYCWSIGTARGNRGRGDRV